MKRNRCLTLALLLVLALPAVLLATEAPAPPVATAPANAAYSGCAPAPSGADGLFSPAAAPPVTPWDQRIELATCDCSGFDCGFHCSPIQCVLLPNGHCGAICRCRP
jgi:hypothetical protein